MGEENREPIQTINKNVPNLWKELDPRIEETNRTPNYVNPKRPFQRHILLKLSKLTTKEEFSRQLRKRR